MKLVDYKPRDFALKLHNRDKRWVVMVCHRRAGKTVSACVDLLVSAMENPLENPQFAYFAPYRSQAKAVAWSYLLELSKEYWSRPPNQAELTIYVRNRSGTESRIFVGGTDNADALRGLYFDGVVLDEVGDMSPTVWYSVIRPALSDRKGWLVAMGTPKGYNMFWNLREEARLNPKTHLLLEVKSSESGILDADELRDAKIQMSEDAFEREFECSFDASVQGSYYGKLIADVYKEGRATDFEIDMEYPVELVADLGFTDSTSWWVWQTYPDGYRMIDFYENHGMPMSHYIDWIKDLPYRVEKIHLPHDAKAKTFQTGRSVMEQFLDADFDFKPLFNVQEKLSIQDGIEAVRNILPNCYFHDAKTSVGIDHLRGYSKEWDDRNSVFKNSPKHDSHSHASDSFRYFALSQRKERTPKRVREVFTTEVEVVSPNRYCLEEIWDTAPKQNRRVG